MQITGLLKDVLAEQGGESKSGKQWRKRNVIIETEGQYPKTICVALWGDKVGIPLSVGSKLSLSVDVESREYNGNWYTEVKAYKVDVIDMVTPAVDFSPQQQRGDVPF